MKFSNLKIGPFYLNNGDLYTWNNTQATPLKAVDFLLCIYLFIHLLGVMNINDY